MKKLICLNFLFLILNSCTGKDCKLLPNSFSSYSHALTEIRKSDFAINETIDTSKSSWIEGLEYHSCDSKVGFLILKTKDREYIHQGVPVSLWKRLKTSPSFGTFYNSELKGKFQLRLE